MWLFILATWFCEDVYTTSTYKPKIYLKEKYLCEANGKDGTKSWYYMRYCYNELQPNSKHIFDYCECRVPKTGEKYIRGVGWLKEYLFCYNYTNNPTKTPQETKIKLAVQSTRPKKIKTALAVFYQLIFIA